jgi:hypothetical protein
MTLAVSFANGRQNAFNALKGAFEQRSIKCVRKCKSTASSVASSMRPNATGI